MHFVHVPKEEPEDLLIHRISGNISTVKGFRDKKEQNRSLDRREILYWSRGYSLRSWIKRGVKSLAYYWSYFTCRVHCSPIKLILPPLRSIAEEGLLFNSSGSRLHTSDM